MTPQTKASYFGYGASTPVKIRAVDAAFDILK